jgi:hypothetical protein
MKMRPVTILAVAALSAAALLAVVSAASAVQSKTVSVSGNSTPSTCNKGKGAGAISLTGDLQGCLTYFPTRYECDELNGFARYTEWGTERFVGTLRGAGGQFTTTYKVVATYATGSCEEFDKGGFPATKQTSGGCEHAVTGRSGAFKGSRGLITFFDVIKPGKGATNYLYAGTLRS